MKIKFQSLTEKGRWLLATLTLIFTLGIGQMWADLTPALPATTLTLPNIPTEGWKGTVTPTYYKAAGSNVYVFCPFELYQSVANLTWTTQNSGGSTSATPSAKAPFPASSVFEGYKAATLNGTSKGPYAYRVTNCVAAYVYCKSGSDKKRTITLAAYEIDGEGNVAASAAASDTYEANSDGVISISLNKDKEYYIKVSQVGSGSGGSSSGNSSYYMLGLQAPYKVTLDPNGGAYPSNTLSGWTYNNVSGKYSKYVTAGSLTLPEGPAKGGFNFVEWQDNKGTAFSSITVSQDTVLTAQWQSAGTPTHDISYTNLKGSDVSAYPTEYYEGTGIASFDALADVTDFHFNGWSPASISASATTDQTIAATWVAAYNVTFSAGAGSGTVPASFQKWEGATFELPGQGSMVAPSGKAFDGWKANGAGSKLDAGSEYTMGGSAVNFVAQWKSVPTTLYSLTVTNTNSVNLNNGGAQNDLADDATIVGGGAYMQNDHASNAQQILGSTKLQFKAGTVTLVMTLTNSLKEGDTIKATGLNSEGLCFGVTFDRAGSLDNQLASDASYFIVPEEFEGKTTLYAWRHSGSGTTCASIIIRRPADRPIASTEISLSDVKVNDASISAANLATLVANHSLLLEDEFAAAPVIKFNEHKVITYADGESPATKESDKVYTVTATINGEGKWQAAQEINSVTYTVTATKLTSAKVYYYDGETKLGEEIVAINGSPVEAGDYDDKTLASFVGWYNNADLEEEHKIDNIAELVVTANVNVYGKWTNIYATSANIEQWVLDNGKSYGAVAQLGTLHYASNISNSLDSLNDDPSKTNRNYAYLGLKVKASGKMLDFRLANGSTVKVKFGATGNYPQVAINGGSYAAMSLVDNVWTYTAEGADAYISIKSPNGDTEIFKQIMIDEDLKEITLPWRVTYDANGGTCATAEAIWSGADLTLPAVTAPTDYSFAGWYDGDDLAGAAGASYTATKNVTLQAHYAPVVYAINYLPGDHGAGDYVIASAGWGTEYTVQGNPFTPESGYIFDGWTVSGVDGVSIIAAGGSFTMPKNVVILTAIWVDSNVALNVDTDVKYESLAEAIANATTGQTIQLLQNVSVTAQIEVAGKAITLDLAGKKIEYTGSATLPSGVILVHNGASLTINDSSDPDAGSIVSGANAYAAIALTKAGDDATNPAVLEINGGTFTGDYYAITGNGSRHNTQITINAGTFSGAHSEDNSAIYHPQQGTLIVNGGTFTGYSAAIELRAGTLEINDGTFTATATEYSCNPSGSGTTTVGAAIAIAQHNTQKDIAVTINGGTFEGVKAINEANPQGNPAPAVAMSVTDGDFTGELSTVDVDYFVSAGSFSVAVPVEYCAAGYIPAPQNPVTNKYSVKEGWKVTFVDGVDEEIVPVDKNTPVAEKAMSDKAGYIFDGWLNGVDLYDFAANVTADLTLNAKWTAFAGCADLWPATGSADLNSGDVVDLQTGSFGGTIVASTDNISYGEYGLLLKTSGSTYVTVTLNNDMVENTKITVVLAAGGTSERGVNLRAAVGTTNVQQMKWTPAAIGEEKTFEYTLDSESALKDKNIFYLYRNGNVYIKSIRVESCGDPVIYHNLTSEVNIAGKGTVTLGASVVRENHTTTATYSDIDPLYEFVSWSVSGAGASVADASANPATITVGTEDAVVTLNLKLIPVKFTVNYYDGSTLKGSEEVEVNEHPTASEINTNKRHFTFQGWSDTDGGDVVALNTITSAVAATINLYAVYEPVACPTEGTVFSMEFDNTKAPESTVKVAKNGGSIDLANYATLVGGAAVINNTETSDKDAISTDGKFLLKATKEVMKIELDCAIATGDVIRIPDNNAKYVLSTSDSKTGTYQERTSSQHEFEATAAWNGVDDLYILYDGSSLNFTKVYVLRPYTISFDLQGHGDAIDAQKLVAGKKVVAPTAPTADGWDFGGWYKEAACTNAWDFDNDVVEGSISIYAKWSEHVTNDATLKSLKYGTTAITLVDGIYTYEVELAAAVAAVPALAAETNADLATRLITDATEFVAGQATSTVLVTAEDGATQLLYTVNFTKEAALPQVNVTEATVWNFATAVAGSSSMENLTDVVLANVPGITNDATFNSQALKGTFNKMPGNYFQGSKLSFTTEVDGMLRVIFRGTNNNSRHLQVCVGEGEEVIADWDYKGSGADAEKDSAIYVPAGKVTLKAFEGNSANNARIYRMELVTADNYHRTVNPSYLGTLCWTNNAVLGGATLYEFAGKNEYNYLVFDEVPENRLEAGKPYIFMPENGNTQIKLYNTDNEAALTEDQAPVNNMYGTIVGKTLVPGQDDNMYYFSSNHIWAVKDFSVSITVPAYYCYVDYEAVLAGDPAPAAAPGRRRVTMGVNGKDTATGIDAIEASEQPMKLLINGQIFILRGEKLFDATGRLVK